MCFVMHSSFSYHLLFVVFNKGCSNCKKTQECGFKTKGIYCEKCTWTWKNNQIHHGSSVQDDVCNDHMVESAGHGQRREWLQWHKRPINILHNIELYIYTLFFLLLLRSLSCCTTALKTHQLRDLMRHERPRHTKLLDEVPFFSL